MSKELIRTLSKCLIDTAVFLEYTEEDELNEGTAVKMLEQLGSELRSLNDKDKEHLVCQINGLAEKYPQSVKLFVKQLPHNLGVRS